MIAIKKERRHQCLIKANKITHDFIWPFSASQGEPTRDPQDDRHQWLGLGFRGSLLLNMDTLFLKAIIYVLYH